MLHLIFRCHVHHVRWISWIKLDHQAFCKQTSHHNQSQLQNRVPLMAAQCYETTVVAHDLRLQSPDGSPLQQIQRCAPSATLLSSTAQGAQSHFLTFKTSRRYGSSRVIPHTVRQNCGILLGVNMDCNNMSMNAHVSY